MKRANHLSTTSKKSTGVPELPHKKGKLNSSHKTKEKHNAKPTYEKIEPMVLRSPPTGESIVRYALPIPSTMTKDLVSDAEMVRRIAKNLKMILESLYKWFQQQVNQMEEISKDQSNLQRDIPSDKFVKLGITQIAKLLRKFEEIRNRLRERKVSEKSNEPEKEAVAEPTKTYELIEKEIEEFIKSHSDIELQTFSETESGTPSSMSNRVSVMMKVFENQTTMLQKALNDQTEAEAKYKMVETNYQILLSEKSLLESEIQQLKEIERLKSTTKEDRTKKTGKSEKKKDKDSERKISPNGELQSFEELAEIQETERSKSQLNLALNQKTAVPKEGKSKTKLDRAQSKSKVKVEDSKDSLLKKSDSQSGGQRQDQTSSDQSKRSVGER
ncbi:coiled-coil domain-containing protein 7-like isoform X2 [Rattus rattus]|uniref:coiled-coil domain-containing protein 7-like isoform X2 n=1 Tax=Rattus rattus TaxID=10117 RepID=UPI0013F37546|nr:coiled-coil domain-containing protein 7-like isoform X2 [Rattus rattus]